MPTQTIPDADYWTDDFDPDDYTHRTLVDAVKHHINQACGVTPRDIFVAPPKFLKIELSHTSEEMHLTAIRDDYYRAAFLESLRALEPRTFYAWKRTTVSRTLIESIAEDAVEHVFRYGGLEVLIHPGFGLRACDRILQQRLEVAFAAVLTEQLLHDQWRPWRCEQVGEVSLNAVQIEAMMREHYPHWFE